MPVFRTLMYCELYCSQLLFFWTSCYDHTWWITVTWKHKNQGYKFQYWLQICNQRHRSWFEWIFPVTLDMAHS